MIPALGFFVPFAIRCKMRARCKLSPKQWLGEHGGRLQTSSKEAQCSSFNRLSIAYLRLNILEADCSAREGNSEPEWRSGPRHFFHSRKVS